jgi:aldehyde:ferredoxin oxidoreductase
MELYEKGILSKKETNGLELTWGNPESLLILIEQIANKKGFGRILADGTHKAAEKLGKGKDSLIQVKGMDLIMADPRGLKGFGLGYAVASRGGDHLRSEPFIEISDNPAIGERMFGVPGATLRRSDHGKGKLVSYFEDWCAVVDSLEPCKNIAENMELLPFDRASEIMRLVTGIKFSPENMRNAGARIVNIERMFGVREGITRENDTLPIRFTQPLTEGNSKGQIVNLDMMLDEYYDERGWDKKTGIPTKLTLKNLGLNFVNKL